MKKTVLLVICLALVLTTVGLAAVKNPFVGSPKEEYYMITFLSGIEFWKGVYKGFDNAANLLGVKAVYTGAPQYDVNQQATVMEQVIAKKPAGIAVTCANPDGMKAVINKAIAAGIPVICFDSDSPASDRYAYLGTRDYDAGAVAGRYMSKLLGGSGEIAINYVMGIYNQEQRKAGFVDTLAKEFPNIKIVAVGNNEGDQTKAATLTNGFLQAHPNLKGIFTCNAPGGVGVAAAIRETNNVGKVKIVSFDTDKGTMDQVKAGVINATVAQGVWTEGYWSMMFLYNVKHNLANPVAGWKTKGINPLPVNVDTGVSMATKENMDAFK